MVQVSYNEEGNQQIVYFFLLASSSAFCRFRSYQHLFNDSKKVSANLRFPDLALAFVAGSCTLVTEGAVSLELALLSGNLAGSLGDEGGREGNRCAGGGSGEVGTL